MTNTLPFKSRKKFSYLIFNINIINLIIRKVIYILNLDILKILNIYNPKENQQNYQYPINWVGRNFYT